MTPATRRRLAKALFRASGYLSRVKTPQRVYTVNDALDATFAGWHWTSCRPSIWLLEKSMRLDWWHWDHWACVHDTCDPRHCAECGGQVCALREADTTTHPTETR